MQYLRLFAMSLLRSLLEPMKQAEAVTAPTSQPDITASPLPPE